MARTKYKYNPKTLNYEKVEYSSRDYFLMVGKHILIFGLYAVVGVLLFNTFFTSAKEANLKRENQFLRGEIDQIEAKLDTLNTIAYDLQEKDDKVYRNIFGAEPYPDHLRRSGIGGADRYRNMRGFASSDQIIKTKKIVSQLERRFVAQSQSLEELFELAGEKNEMLASIPAIQPVSNKDLKRMASGYGFRIHPIYKIPKFHAGMDFTADTGTEIHSTGDGQVTRIERENTGYGWNVIVKHGFGYSTLYAHMSRIDVRMGQKVNRGETIGLIGSTGTSVGPHLHYEVIKDGEKVNPAFYYFNDLTPEEYEEMLEKSQQANQSLD